MNDKFTERNYNKHIYLLLCPLLYKFGNFFFFNLVNEGWLHHFIIKQHYLHRLFNFKGAVHK